MTRGKKRMLTDQQVDNLEKQMIDSGKNYKEIAALNGIKPPTVYAAFRRLNREIPNLKTRKKKELPVAD